MGNRVEVAVAWSGLPYYAARLIRAGIESLGKPVAVLGTRPAVPISDMEEALGRPVVWLETKRRTSWDAIGLPPPRVFIHTGWGIRPFNDLGREVRRNGGRVVAMIDNSDKRSFRQVVGAIVFRLVYRRRFWGVWVPGRSAGRLCAFLGTPSRRIHKGLYGADSGVFFPGATPIWKRGKVFAFVGQLIRRKGLLELLDAFRFVREKHGDAELLIAGSGPLEERCRQIPGVRFIGFAQPSEVAATMRKARCLVLPSHEEHWGLVVHEAALSGCALILSDTVGSSEDLLGNDNGICVRARSVGLVADAMMAIAEWDATRLDAAGSESIRLASAFGPVRWARVLQQIVTESCATVRSRRL